MSRKAAKSLLEWILLPAWSWCVARRRARALRLADVLPSPPEAGLVLELPGHAASVASSPKPKSVLLPSESGAAAAGAEPVEASRGPGKAEPGGLLREVGALQT